MAIMPSPHIQLYVDGDRRGMVITKVRYADSGSYKITISNPGGTAWSAARLIVEGQLGNRRRRVGM